MKTLKLLGLIYLASHFISCQKEPIEFDRPVENGLTIVNAKSGPKTNNCISINDCPPFLSIVKHPSVDKSKGSHDYTATTVFKGAIWRVSRSGIVKRTRTRQTKITKSYNGILWNIVATLKGNRLSPDPKLVVFNNELWLSGNSNSHPFHCPPLFKSSNGSHWVRADASRIDCIQNLFVFQDRLYAYRGNNEMFYTTDGVTWRELHYSPSDPLHQRPQRMVIFKNHVYAFIFGGHNRDDGTDRQVEIWKSSDGRNWSKLRPRYPFMSSRAHFSVSSYKGKLWVIGGHYGRDSVGIFYNEIWYSQDAINWKKFTGENAIEGIIWHSATVFKDKLWLFDGTPDGSECSPTYEISHK